MAKSLSPGIRSSNSRRKLKTKSERALNHLANSELIQTVYSALGEKSKLHLVGGTVRNIILGKTAGDLDLTCVLKPQQSRPLLTKAGLRVVDTGIQHGTLTIVHRGQTLELTTFRKPAKHNKNSYSTKIETDLSGRDFTINAIAFCLSQRRIIDPYKGRRDLKLKKLCAVGDAAKRFKEDPLRILRMLRFGTAEKRRIDKRTLLAAARLAPLLRKVSIERVRVELEKILLAPDAAGAFRKIKELGLLPYTFPELSACVDFEQNKFHIHDVFEHTLWVLKRSPAKLETRLAALFHDMGKPDSLSVDEQGQRHFFCHELLSEKICRKRMKALRFSKKLTERVCRVVRHHMRPLECGPTGARRIVRDLAEDFSLWRELKMADAPPRTSSKEFKKALKKFDKLVRTENERLAQSGGSKLAVNGYDLMGIGIKPGVGMGQILKQLEELVLEQPNLNEKPLLLKAAEDLARKLVQNEASVA